MDNQDDKKQEQHQEYDGIIENNNPMPRWWLTTFYLTIAFALVYYVAFQFMGKLKISDEYEQEMAAHQASLPTPVASGVDDQAITQLTSDPAALADGKAVFIGKCAVCHLPEGGGSIGPNLTDNFWIHGDGKAAGIVEVVIKGVDGKGMPPWGTLLTADEVKKVTAFILSLRGTKPATPKAPQGEEHAL